MQPGYVLTSDERLSIAAALDTELVEFQSGSEELQSLRSLGLPYEAIDQGVCDWFGLKQYLADDLLLVWSDFESLVSNFVAEMRPPSFPWQ